MLWLRLGGLGVRLMGKNGGEILVIRQKCLPLQSGKSYTASSLSTPPGLDRSKGSRL